MHFKTVNKYISKPSITRVYWLHIGENEEKFDNELVLFLFYDYGHVCSIIHSKVNRTKYRMKALILMNLV